MFDDDEKELCTRSFFFLCVPRVEESRFCEQLLGLACAGHMIVIV